MKKRFPLLAVVLGSVCWILPGVSPAAPAGPPPDARVRTVFSQALPQMDATHLQVTTVEVTYPPGGSSTPHTHPCPVIGYVLKGAVRMQVKGGVPATYTAGESFYEAPDGIHLISENVSATEPATFLAYFICDHSAPLSANVPATPSK